MILKKLCKLSYATPRADKDEKGNKIQFAECFYLRKFTVTDKSKNKIDQKVFPESTNRLSIKDIVIN